MRRRSRRSNAVSDSGEGTRRPSGDVGGKGNITREFLQEIEIFRGLSPSVLGEMAAAVEEVALPADTYLFRAGDHADALFIIRAGSVRVVRQRPQTGGAMVAMHMAAGTVVGEVGVLGGIVRAISVMTDTASVFLKLHRSAFQELAAKEPLLRSRLEEAVSTRRRSTAQAERIPEGDAGIQMVGHRDYVGGLWQTMGQLQLDFLVAQGLTPSHCLLDIACGALRAGVRFIDYLEPGHYLGLEKEKTLIELGIDRELGRTVYEQKRPEFVISASFEFHKFSRKAHFSLAQSLFTHLIPRDIRLCLRNLRGVVDSGHLFFATFFEGDSAHNPSRSVSQAGFWYARAEMGDFGTDTGWTSTYMAAWGHPRHQMMMRYEAV